MLSVFQLMDDTLANLATRLKVELPEAGELSLDGVSSMPSCRAFKSQYKDIQAVLKLYTELLNRDADELLEFIDAVKQQDST